MGKARLFIFLCMLGGCVCVYPIDRSKIKFRNIHVEADIPESKKIGIRVIGGQEAAPNSVPYMAAIIVEDVFCGASLITRSWVLTAAHCTEGSNRALVILGAHKPLYTELTQVTIFSNRIVNHPGWDSSRLINDIALIQLPAPVPLTSNIQTIPIAPAHSGSFAGAIGRLTGWGYTSDHNPGLSDTLQQVHLEIISLEECKEYAGIWAHESNVCTSGFNGNYNVGSCFGDSGSPIIAEGVLVGVVSFGAGQCASGSITSYARVSHYANWIERYTNS